MTDKWRIKIENGGYMTDKTQHRTMYIRHWASGSKMKDYASNRFSSIK